MTDDDSRGEKPTDSEGIDWEGLARAELFGRLASATYDLDTEINKLAHRVTDGDDVTSDDIWTVRSALRNTETDVIETLEQINTERGDEATETILLEYDFLASRLHGLARRARNGRLNRGDVAAAREQLEKTDGVLEDLERSFGGDDGGE